MKKDIIYSLSSPYRDDFRVTGYRFGKGGKSCCIIGSIRGNEIQQLYMCSQLVRALDGLEKKGCISYDREILIIPSLNSYGTNISKRFWCLDNTDINRMFPGDPDGETTERIAAGVFSEICKYQYGVQFELLYTGHVHSPCENDEDMQGEHQPCKSVRAALRCAPHAQRDGSVHAELQLAGRGHGCVFGLHQRHREHRRAVG